MSAASAGHDEEARPFRAARLHRFFVRPERVCDGKVRIEGPDARQICQVLRLGRGDEVAALDGTGRAMIVRISDASATRVVGDVLEVCRLGTEPRVRVTLAQALPKGDKLEFVIQKGTELGVARFEVVTTARAVPRPPDERIARRIARWRAIAKEAAEQSCRAVIPEVAGITPLEQFVPRIAGFDLALCLWEGEDGTTIRDLLTRNRSAENILILVGPEGGFEEDEVRTVEASGAVTVSLGRRILRSETAAIAAAAIVLYELET